MTVKHSSIFTAENPLNGEPVTILVEYIEAEGFRGVSIESLEGEYPTAEEFDEAARSTMDGKGRGEARVYTFIAVGTGAARRLADALDGALEASGEG